MTTVAASYAQNLVDELRDDDFVDSVSVDENHHGVYLDVTVPDPTAESRIYEMAEDEPVWMEISVA